MRDLSGTMLGHYEVMERLGAGGMAVVYRATQQPLGREVALKVLAEALVEEPGFARRFENEARTLARLDHPNILPIYDFDSVDGVVYLAMPLVRGGTVRDILDRGALDPVSAWRYLREVGDALHHAHEAGVIHRDLKPTNILVHADGRAMLADFGLARSPSHDQQLTSAGIVLGTPGYMAPEQVLGRDIDRRADIYALGVLTFEMLTGQLPFKGGNAMETAYATVSQPVPSATALNHNLPDELDALLAKVLAKDPAQRPPTAAILVAELGRLPQRRAVQSKPPAAPPPPPAPAAAPGPSVALRPAISDSPPPSSAVGLLAQLGIKRSVAATPAIQNAYWANAVHVAREVAGDRWPDVVAAAGLANYLEEDGPADDQFGTPAENPSRLNEAFDLVFGPAAPDHVRLWGRRATERQLRMRKAGTGGFRLLRGSQRKLAVLLDAHTESLDEIRGGHCSGWKQLDADQAWLAHFSNLFAFGRVKREKSCHFWTASLEAMLRQAALANDWYVEELECGSVTGTYDCVFAIRSAKT